MKSNSKDILEIMKWENSNMIFGATEDAYYNYIKYTDILNIAYMRAVRGIDTPSKAVLESEHDKMGSKKFFENYITEEVLTTPIIKDFKKEEFTSSFFNIVTKEFIKIDSRTVLDASHTGFVTFMDKLGMTYVFSKNRGTTLCTLSRSKNKRDQSQAEVLFDIYDYNGVTDTWDKIKEFISTKSDYSILEIEEYYTKEELRDKYKEAANYTEGMYLFNKYGDFNDHNNMGHDCILKAFIRMTHGEFKMKITGTHEYLTLESVPSIDNDIEVYSITFGNDVYMISWYSNFVYKINDIRKNSVKISEYEYIDLCNLIVSACIDKSRNDGNNTSSWDIKRNLCECSKYVSAVQYQHELEYAARETR